jgi:hypothetical protein
MKREFRLIKNGRVLISNLKKYNPEILLNLKYVKFLLEAGRDGIHDYYYYCLKSEENEALKYYEMLLDSEAILITNDKELKQLYEKVKENLKWLSI